MVLPKLFARASPSSGSHQGAPPGHPRQLDPTNEVRMVYDMVSGTAKLYGPAEAVGRCTGEMLLVLAGGTTAGPNAATTDRKERRAKAKETAKEKAKKLAEGMKEGAAYAAPPTSPDSQSSEEEREEGSYPEPNASADSEPSGSQQGTEDEDAEATQAAPRDPMQAADEGAEDEGAEEADEGAEEEQASRGALAQRADELAAKRLAADDHDQDSEDTKEEGDTGDEEHEAEEKDGEGKGQAGPTLTTAESAGGGDACSFSPPPVDRTHHSPGSGKRRMSDEQERNEETRQIRLELERAQEQFDNGEKWISRMREEGMKRLSDEDCRLREEGMKRLGALRRRYNERDPKDYQQFKERKKRERLRKGPG